MTQGSLNFDLLDRQQEAHGPRLGLGIRRSREGSGEERKADAMAAALGKRPAQIYKEHLESALLHFPPRSRFTVEQITGIVGRPPAGVHYNVTGAIVNGMAARGLIRKTGRMVKATRPGMHATEIAEWELVKYPTNKEKH